MPSDSLKVFIGGLTGETTEENITEHFSQFGEVLDTQIVVNPKTNTLSGFGFVTLRFQGDPKSIYGADHLINGSKVLYR